MGLAVGRITLDDPAAWPEPAGEAVTKVGAVPMAGPRGGLSLSPQLTTWTDAQAGRARLRRQLRSLVGNLQTRLRGVYVAWDQDPEQDGWYVPGQLTLQLEGTSLDTAVYDITGEWALLGRPRTHRRGVLVRATDRRASTTPRDVLKRVYSTDFSGMTPLTLSWLPSGAADITLAATASATLTGPRSGYGSSSLQAIVGATDLADVTFDQAASARNLGDVLVYDRRGMLTAPSTGPDTTWDEVYGPDWACDPAADWAAGADTPLLDNGLARVRWDASNTPGWRLDRWTGSAWAEVGKVLVYRIGDTNGMCDTLVSAGVVEWAPDRAVIRAVLRRSADAYSREECYLTLQAGWTGPRVEVYPAPKTAAAAGAGVYLFEPAAVAGGTAILSQATVLAAWASAGFSPAAIGAFTGENWATLLSGASGAPQVTLAALQATASAAVTSGTEAYGSTRNGIGVQSISTAGYVSAQIGLAVLQADQRLEAEAMTLAAGTTSTADGAASGGNAATATRTSEANHVTKATWPNSVLGKYRVLARVKTSAGTMSIRAKTGTTTGAVKTTTSTSYVWVDLGDVVADGGTLTITAWTTSGTLSLDRIDAVLVEDRTATSPVYAGARDLGQAILVDSRYPQIIVAR